MKKIGLIITIALLSLAIMAPLVSAASPEAAPSKSGGYWYTVHYGDTLSGIAYRTGTTVRQLIKVNGLRNANWIYVGQRLWIPSHYTPPPTHGGTYHTVKYGQTLSGIAQYYGINMWRLAEANNVYNLNHIYVGQVLRVPTY